MTKHSRCPTPRGARIFLKDLFKVRRRELLLSIPPRAKCGTPNPRSFSFTPQPASSLSHPCFFSQHRFPGDGNTGKADKKQRTQLEGKSKQTKPPARNRDPTRAAFNHHLQPRPGLHAGPAPCPAARAHLLAPFLCVSPLMRFRPFFSVLGSAPPLTERQRSEGSAAGHSRTFFPVGFPFFPAFPLPLS